MSSLYPPFPPEPRVPGPAADEFRQPFPFSYQPPVERSPFSPAPFISQVPSLHTLLPQVQNMIRIAQTVAPYVKQYYPIVRQLPTLWKLLSAAPSTGFSEGVLEDTEKTTNYDWNTADIDDFDTPPPKLYI
ncbi:VrrA/YqfQ family protein [Salibacterium aidingense]|uniref:VrrA/YqfQ family protein n=1 Tax=Salibacterium aidingense TaxID=384933 RepID=UPI0003F9C00A|nr:VrrA/YqfQ family protein [Salibacterium aidingense]